MDIQSAIVGLALGALATLLIALWRKGNTATELSIARQRISDLQEQHGVGEAERGRLEEKARRAEEIERALESARTQITGLATEKATFQEQATRVPVLEQQLDALSKQLAELSQSKADLDSNLAAQTAAHEEKLKAIAGIREQIDNDLKIVAVETLRTNQEAFLQMAVQVFETHKLGAVTELETRSKAIEALFVPITETLKAYQDGISELEKSRATAYGALSSELKNVVDTQNAVRLETSRLVNALRAAPKTRGRWGEHTLKRVLELSELTPHCDFKTEESVDSDAGRLRPDVIVNLPGNRSLVIDAKTSTSAYIDAVEAVDEDIREQHLQLHAKQLRTHMKQLAGKAYWDSIGTAPDFVVMFIPGDNFYVAAAERDPKLFEDAVASKVLIVTPATLIALAKAVAYGWRQEKVAENAKMVHELGKDLYRRLSTMSGHISGTGDALGQAVKRYNDFVGSLEGSVMPQARRFRDLEVEGTGTEMKMLSVVEIEPRQLRTDRDMVFPPGATADIVAERK